ncbi:DUF262 domain-containing protein [Pseudomonas mosselii]|uniref:DUF262 domain-containing protein n=1 Tax=Pseudomonas mosselii TaxID=78327 RepID=A0AA42RVI5_9PSED|nr:DUF262 domain-containing protein [Pseudomonas mosselii]MDH1629300.1 DUF262 domain-containing protein [Pseudomonas mosselii]
MALTEEIQAARKKVVTDGYEMSVGEIINLYRDGELVIDPVFQRLFRWDDERKTRFIESVVLGIPIPPIFVYQDANGVWELIDGLQRLSTILQFTGDLRGDRANELGPLVLNGTRFLPSLDGKRWKESVEGAGDGFSQSQQIEIKRARLRVEILKADSDESAKFELFQRLNTGGVSLTEQEVRNSMAISIDRGFYDWLIGCSQRSSFVTCTDLTDYAIESQLGVELALRFFAFRSIPYEAGLDVHEYLDDALIRLASAENFGRAAEGEVFARTFDFLEAALNGASFKRWNGRAFTGKFLMSVFELLSTSVSQNLAQLEAMPPEDRNQRITEVAQQIWSHPTFLQYSGAGIRGTTRLTKLLPLAPELFRI